MWRKDTASDLPEKPADKEADSLIQQEQLQMTDSSIFDRCQIQANLSTHQEQCMQAKTLMDWGAEGVIVGSALVKALGEAGSPEAGLQALTDMAVSIRSAI